MAESMVTRNAQLAEESIRSVFSIASATPYTSNQNCTSVPVLLRQQMKLSTCHAAGQLRQLLLRLVASMRPQSLQLMRLRRLALQLKA